MLDHFCQIPGVGQLKYDIELVFFDERGEVLDDIWVVQLLRIEEIRRWHRHPKSISYLQQLDLPHAIQPRFGVHHFENLHLFERHNESVLFAGCSVDHGKLPLADLQMESLRTARVICCCGGKNAIHLSIDFKIGQSSVGRILAAGHLPELGRGQVGRSRLSRRVGHPDGDQGMSTEA